MKKLVRSAGGLLAGLLLALSAPGTDTGGTNLSHPVSAEAAETTVTSTYGLTPQEKRIYRYLKEELQKIADGSRSSTRIEIKSQKILDGFGTTKTTKDVYADLQILADRVDTRAIMVALKADLPYDLYWTSSGVQYEYGTSSNGKKTWMSSMSVVYGVTSQMQGKTETTLKKSAVKHAKKCKKKADAIIKKYAKKSDLAKLTAYMKEICKRTRYDEVAAAYPADVNVESYGIGQSFQMLSIFDGDPDTNVVCEGYAKAFKYLCDNSSFESSKVACIFVTGTMYPGGYGGHGWNIVKMPDGKRYIVDVTNCDEDTVGAPDQLFLFGNKGSVASGYKFGNSLHYQYDADTLLLFKPGWLKIAASPY